jgi:hypothetical protein
MTVFELANVSYHNKIKIYVGVLFIYIEMMYDIYLKKNKTRLFSFFLLTTHMILSKKEVETFMESMKARLYLPWIST